MPTRKDKKIVELYEDAIKQAEEHFKELHEVIDSLEAKVELAIYYLSDSIGKNEREGTRWAHQLVHHEDWLYHCPGEYLTRKEHNEWFDIQHDRRIAAGDYISNANGRDIMEWYLQDIKKLKKNNVSPKQLTLPGMEVSCEK